MKNKYSIWLYVTTVFVLSYGWQYLIYVTGGVESTLFPFLMWFPGIIAVLFVLLTRRGFRKIGWGLKKWRYIFPAILIPFTIALGLMFLIQGLNWGSLVDRLFVFKDGSLESSQIGLLLGNQKQSIPFFIFNVVLSHIVFLVGGSVLTLGEEFGWRGYSQEAFVRKYGFTRGFVILGAIWGYWHLPIILMGYNFPTQPLWGGLILMPAGTIFLGIFLGWIYLRSKSIWMPALAHASVNLFSGFLYGMTMHQDDILRGIVWIGAWGVVATICLLNLLKNKPILWQEMKATADNRASVER